ncbi:EF-P lysine aminoacylase GenX [bacterium]|nr:EF-P lysine aminoacylase GenX [bacterium]
MLSQKKKHTLKKRAEIISAVRSFFENQNFIEVETPLKTTAPLPEQNIDALKCGEFYLATSPEPYMKRLVAGGLNKIFQITKCFRNGEIGDRHNIEFSMLEWYRNDADYLNLIDDVKNLLNFICDKINFSNIFSNFEIISLDDAWVKFTGKPLDDIPNGFDFDKTMIEKIEPGLNLNKLTIITDFPACFSPMCKQKSDNPYRAERLEIYFNGIELGNGCTEQIDKKIQIKRLRDEQLARKQMGKDVYPWPSEFVDSLDNMPASAGMALGIDRLIMILCNEDKIEDVIAFTEK